jgi:hypothetical protein
MDKTLSQSMDELDEVAMRVKAQRDRLLEAATPIVEAFHYDPGHSDLDNEQPIHISTTLGAWRKLNYAVRSSG